MAAVAARRTLAVLLTTTVAVSLQGCGSPKHHPPSPSPTPSPSQGHTTTTTTTRPSSDGWRSAPIDVRGSHLYDSVTGERFHAKGIGMPNVGEDVEEWIRVLRRIKDLSPEVNLVRIYVPPTCALESDCFKPFMREADKLGVYVLVPGTGTVWGWLPGSPGACGTPATAEGCYKAGGVLGFGQKVVQRFNYPNTLAIVIGNEFDMQMAPYIALLKAYARDLKAYMNMCDTNAESPTKGMMRKIPLMYANSDDRGDAGVRPKADYLFCGDSSVSIDIFGLNVERWCEDKAGRGEYDKINKWVGAKSYPGAFLFSEMGCAKINVPATYNRSRTWTQVHDFFTNYPAIDGFAAYTYNGNKDFDMFDGPTADAEENDDGRHFFESLGLIGDLPQTKPNEVNVPECVTSILGVDIGDYRNVSSYETGPTGWAPSCPKPYQTENTKEADYLDIIV